MSTQEKPRLWSWDSSPFAGKVRVALAEKGIDFELHEIHPVRRPERLRELNPLGRVPVLELADGTAIRESTVICEWLEETHSEPALWPADAAARARGRGLLAYIDGELTASFFLGMRKLVFGADETDPPDITERLHARLGRRWPVLERALEASGGPWLLGDSFTFADVGAMALAVRLPQWKPELQPDSPLLSQWLETLRQRPSAAAIEQRGEPRHAAGA